MNAATRDQRALFGQIALEQGFLSQADVDLALEEQRDWRNAHGMSLFLGQILHRRRRLTMPQVIAILRRQLFLRGTRSVAYGSATNQ